MSKPRLLGIFRQPAQSVTNTAILKAVADGKLPTKTSLKFLSAAVDPLRDIAKTQAVVKQES